MCFRNWLTPAAFAVAALLPLDTHATVDPPLQVKAVGTECPSWTNQVTASGSYSGSAYTLDGAGHDFYWCWDRGAFAYTEVAGDFSFSARIKTAPSTGPAKFGIAVREDLSTTARTASIRYDFGQNSQTWFYRVMAGTLSSTGEKSCPYFENKVQTSATEGVTYRISRTGSTVTLAIKQPGSSSFTNVDPTSNGGVKSTFSFAGKVYVGLILSTGDRGAVSGSVTFDNIELTGSATRAERPLTTATPDGTCRYRGFVVLGLHDARRGAPDFYDLVGNRASYRGRSQVLVQMPSSH